MLTIVIFIAVLAVLVLSHEFGHFIVARKNGIKVEEFGFGFAPRLVGIHRIKYHDGRAKWHIVWGNRAVTHEVTASIKQPGTVYSINLFPFGGFVRIKGEDGVGVNDPDSFVQKSAWVKMAVVAAGVFMNLVLAWVLLSVGFMIGSPAVGSDLAGNAVQNVRVHIMDVLPGKPAAVAGLEPGDIVLRLDQTVSPSLATLQNYFNSHSDKAVEIEVERNGASVIKHVVPVYNPDIKRAGIGVAIVEAGTIKYPWYLAIYHGFTATWVYLGQIFVAFYLLIKGLFSGGGAGAAVSGPVGVAIMTGEAARLGLTYLLQFTAMLSLNLAVLNILPIPALDGGRLLFLIMGKILRRPISPRAEAITHSIGFVLLLVLVIAVTVKDIGNFWGVFVSYFQK